MAGLELEQVALECDAVQLSAAYMVGLLVRARHELRQNLNDEFAERSINNLVAHIGEKYLCDESAMRAIGFVEDGLPDTSPGGVTEYLTELALLANDQQET